MELLLAVCVIIASIAITAAIYLHIKLKLFKNNIKNNPGFETQMILADMMLNGTLLRIERVPPENFFLRRP